MDVIHYNSQAWDKQVDQGNEWTQPVDADVIERARAGNWEIVLTPTKPVPRDWFGDIQDKRILCLASGGGQQGPILAAAGAQVTTFDNSPNQLQRDREVAERDQLEIELVCGNMANLEMFSDEAFDLIFNPCSICFSPDPRAVWKECYRVLKGNGRLMTGVANPVLYLLDDELLQKGKLEVCYRIPYSDATQLSDDQKQKFIETGEPFAFGHSWDDLIGGMVDSGLHICGFFEDGFGEGEYQHLNDTINTFAAILATKPA